MSRADQLKETFLDFIAFIRESVERICSTDSQIYADVVITTIGLEEKLIKVGSGIACTVIIELLNKLSAQPTLDGRIKYLLDTYAGEHDQKYRTAIMTDEIFKSDVDQYYNFFILLLND